MTHDLKAVAFLASTGSPTEDEVLTIDTSGIGDDDGLDAFSYQWLRDGAVIGGATNGTYTLTNADVDAQVSVRVTYTDGHGTSNRTALVLSTGGVLSDDNDNENSNATKSPNQPEELVQIDSPPIDVESTSAEDVTARRPTDLQTNVPEQSPDPLLAAPSQTPAPAAEGVLEEIVVIEHVKADTIPSTDSLRNVLRTSMANVAVNPGYSLPSVRAVVEAVTNASLSPFTNPDLATGQAVNQPADEIVLGATKVVATAMSVGYIVWTIRGGALVASLVASQPAWMSLDTLPVTNSFGEFHRPDA